MSIDSKVAVTFASSADANVTYPKPRERPDDLSYNMAGKGKVERHQKLNHRQEQRENLMLSIPQ